MGSPSDDDLMRMHAEGDRDAFDALFARHHGAVYNFARFLLDGQGGADDVLQATFLAVARAGDGYQPRGRFKPWLMRITRNLCLNRRRDAQLRARSEAGAAEAVRVVPPPAPDARMAREELTDELHRAIAALPERQREALVLHAFEGMPYADIAEALDAPLNTVKTLIHRARARLARALYEEE